jgi:hypothetical protein
MKTLRSASAFAALLALGSLAAAAQSASFIVSQNGQSIGTASYAFTSTPSGYNSESLVNVSMQGLNYALSKTERLTPANHLKHVLLSGTVNGSAVNIIAKPDPNPNPAQLLMNISANGRASTARLDEHPASVFLPDFDPGALETLLALNAAQNGQNIWAVIPKRTGSVVPLTITADAAEQGTLNGQPITVQHITVKFSNAKMELFASRANRLLQAELPQEGFALVRKGFVLTPPKTAPKAPPQQQPAQQQFAPGQQQSMPVQPQQPAPQPQQPTYPQ